MSGNRRGNNRPPARGPRAPSNNPNSVQRSYASQLHEQDSTFTTYEHLPNLDRADAALTMLRKVGSMVKPIMRKRNWKVSTLAEFLPSEQNLLGLNINRGQKICVRLRYPRNPDLFLPMEQVIDTMLHELSHIVFGAHDGKFHALWDELRDELETLIRKGYTGEGFLSEGKRLGSGGSSRGSRPPPPHELRRLARASAETRQRQNQLTKGSGQRLGGTPLHLLPSAQSGSGSGDIRKIIANQIEQRNAINRGCGSGRADAVQISSQPGREVFATKAEEDDANDRAIAQALYELMELDEERKLDGTFVAPPAKGEGGLAWRPEGGLYDPQTENDNIDGDGLSEEEQMKWAMELSRSSDQHDESAENHFERATSNGRSPESDRSLQPATSQESLTSSTKPSDTGPRPQASPAPEPHSNHQYIHNTYPASAMPSYPTLSPTTTQPLHQHDGPSHTQLDFTHQASPDQDRWSCSVCTCINPLQFLACDACGSERPHSLAANPHAAPATSKPQSKPTGGRVSANPTKTTRTWSAESRALLAGGQANGSTKGVGWNCMGCGAFMEHKWWTCSACGRMKESS